MPLSDVLHQPTAQDRLHRALTSRRIPHAYLFTGPSGVGKEMLATRFAQLLLCGERGPEDSGGLFGAGDHDAPASLSPFVDSCGRCPDCVLFQSDNHPDFHRIYRALNKMHPDKTVQRRKALDLSVDVIRHFVLEPIRLHPSRGRAKVFIVAEAERLTDQAQNAMLKTLEEPPGHSYIILLSSAADELLPTTRSRCQEVPFGTLPIEFVVERLQALAASDPAQAAFYAELAAGSAGFALRYAESGLAAHVPEILSTLESSIEDPLGASKALLDLAKQLAPSDSSREEEEIETSAAREGQKVLLSLLGLVLRDVQRLSVGAAAAALKSEPRTAQLAKQSTPARLSRAIRSLGTTERQIDLNANAALVFDSLAIALSRGIAPQSVTPRGVAPASRR